MRRPGLQRTTGLRRTMWAQLVMPELLPPVAVQGIIAAELTVQAAGGRQVAADGEEDAELVAAQQAFLEVENEEEAEEEEEEEAAAAAGPSEPPASDGEAERQAALEAALALAEAPIASGPTEWAAVQSAPRLGREEAKRRPPSRKTKKHVRCGVEANGPS